MTQTAIKAFKMLRKLRSVTFGTVDENGDPQTRIADIMYYKEDGIYFVTLPVKPFYRQLKQNGKVSLTGMTRDFMQIRINGKVEELGEKAVKEVFKENADFADIFDTEFSQKQLKAFRIFTGKGEIFKLGGKRKVFRERFSFGVDKVHESGCDITEKCIKCNKCREACPFEAIEKGTPYKIKQEFCDECGICYAICPVSAIEMPKGL